MFSFEAGRRCDSGPGNFTFETKQGNEIFLIVESSIKEQKAQADENRQSYSSLDADCPMLMQIRNTIAESVTENNATTTDEELPGDTANTDITSGDTIRTWPINKVGSNEALFVKKEVKLKSLEEREAVKMLKGRVLPEPPVPTAKPTVLNTPPRSPLHKVPKSLLENLEDPTIVYSEPKDSMRFHKPSFDNLYSDPVDSVASGAGKVATLVRPNAMPEEGMLGPLYADLYEQVDLAMLNPPPDVKGKVPKANHIYDEPEGRARPPAPIPTSSLATLKIYDEAILSQDAWKTQAIDEKLGYEYPYNPSTDDYSVPLSQPLNQKPKAKPKGPKPVPAPKPQVTKFGDQGMSGRAPWGTHNVNNSNSSSLVSDAVYSRVIKPGRGQGAAVSPSSDQREGGQEHSVDEQRSTSIYEDLGEL
ncbi:hypothetical protein NDU88_007488 [Pleurodeles waltl]|uniref:IRS-type PTB domain-containing protein n=2 Tax=Pleurodeles waltl TaxID=8319 RepID=A0AAV7WJE7_PLEWA|nr:hypothetical protein NDU88_007488 [Pleurodeles waltl]